MLIFSFAAAYLVLAGSNLMGSVYPALLGGALVGVSPATLAWTRYVLTETLAAAAFMWVVAEILRSYAERRFRLVPLTLSTIVAFWLRFDSVVLLLPIALLAVHLYPVGMALKRTAAVTILLFLPLGAWMVRCTALGLSALPSPITMPSFFQVPIPHGAIALYNSFALNDEDVERVQWNILAGRYSAIVIPKPAFDSRIWPRLKRALGTLSHYDHQAVPAEIDSEFSAIAAQTKKNHPLRTYFLLPLKRAVILWTGNDTLFWFGWPRSLNVISTLAALYHVVLLATAIILFAYRRIPTREHFLLIVALSLVAAKTALLVYVGAIEKRYLTPLYPVLEFATAVAVCHLIGSSRVGHIVNREHELSGS